jgi:Ca2+-binding RTX toxin-like protein
MSTQSIPGPHGKPPVNLPIAPDILMQGQLLENAFQALYALFPGGDPTVDIFTPTGFPAPAPSHPSVFAPNTLYVENFQPVEDGVYGLQEKANAMVVTGDTDAHLIGRFAATELLVGNSGNDTIRGHGGTGTIIAGNGSNHIHSGHGNMYISTGTGNDTIHTGMGSDTVVTHGIATVFAGSGNDVYYDQGQSSHVFVGSGNATLFAGDGTDAFRGGSGLTVMNSGTGSDTFTGGSGFTIMNDTGTGATTFDFNSSYHGDALVQGFNSASDSISLEGYTVNQLMADTTVVGGNSFVNLGDGTKIVFVGVDITKLPSSSFH